MNLKIWRSGCHHLNLPYGKVSLVANLSFALPWTSPPLPPLLYGNGRVNQGTFDFLNRLRHFHGIRGIHRILRYVNVREIEKSRKMSPPLFHPRDSPYIRCYRYTNMNGREDNLFLFARIWWKLSLVDGRWLNAGKFYDTRSYEIWISLMLKILFVNVMRYLLFNFTMYVSVRIFVEKK